MQDKTMINKDRVTLDQYTLKDFSKENPELTISIATFRRGLGELTKAKILALAERLGDYFINPNFVFNGDRVAFTTVLEVEKATNSQKQTEKQIDLVDEISWF